MEQKSNLYMVNTTTLLAVYKQPHTKLIHVGFSQRVDQSEHETGKISSVLLKMSEISLNILRAKYLNG